MNYKLKRILCSLVAVTAASSALPVTAALPADVEGTRFEEPAALLSALKIMNGDENGEFRLDDTIIRSEVTKMAVHAKGLEATAESSKGQSNFLDVSTDHWAVGYINVATSLGLIEGDGDGNFRPNDPISYAEAMAIMLRATGYDVSAENKGGYPLGYMSVGTANGFSKNVICGSNEHITRGNVAYLTANALEVKLMEQTNFGSSSSYEVTEKTLLADYLNVTKDEGQITAVESTSIDGSAVLGKNQVRINDVTYNTSENFNNLLGYNVTYYVREESNGGDTLILARPIEGKNVTVSIDDESFSKLTTKNGNSAIEYFTDNAHKKMSTVELASGAKLIYNGKYTNFDTSLMDLSKAQGKINLLDSDKDGKYDLVFVNKFTNVVVDSVSTSGKVIDKLTGTALKLDDSVDYYLWLGSDMIEPSELEEWDVLSVSKSLDGDLYDITVTRNSVEGKITSINDDGIYVGNDFYKLSLSYTDTLKVGDEGTFYLDCSGRIAGFDNTSGVSTGYAYLLSAYVSNDATTAHFKVFTKSGETKTLEANDKVKVNGTSGVKATEAVNTFKNNNATVMQLVTVSTNSEGKLTAIRTAKDNTETGAIDTNNFTKNYVLDNAQYSAKTGKLGNVRIDENTIVFDLTDADAVCALADGSIFEDEQKYSVIVYDVTESYNAGVIVLTASSVSANDTAPVAVVKSVATAVNGNDEQVERLTALVDGGEKSLFTNAEGVLKKGDKVLKAGDIIQYKTNSDGEIVSVRVLMDIDTKDTETAVELSENLDIVYGRVTKKFANSVNVAVGDNEVVNFTVSDDVKIYEIDTTNSKTNVTQASKSDIAVFDEDEGNRIFLRIYKDAVVEAVIVK